MIIARPITGKLNTIRTILRYVFIAIFIGIPWLEYNGRPAILLDIGSRQFYFPGLVIWPQEFYYLMLLLIISGLALFLFTALFGRLWCGWACPQTVYTDLFDEIGRLFFPSTYGKRSERFWQKIIIHTTWIALSFVLTFHFIAYFVPAREMLTQLFHLGAGTLVDYTWPYFLISTALLFYADIAIFREHMCIYLCPYARFQSVMMDNDSILIAYNEKRGEPRRHQRNKILAASSPHDNVGKEGDCTSCNMCTLVCPTGIDIRNGLQVSCIQCTRCIDACTKEMSKFDKETLISFASIRWQTEKKPAQFLRTRTLVYTALMTFLVGIFGFLFINRVPIQLNIIRDPGLLPFVSDKTVQNFYKLGVGNMAEKPTAYKIEAEIVGNDGGLATLSSASGIDTIDVKPSELEHIRFILLGELRENKPDRLKRNIKVQFIITDINDPTNIKTKETLFTIPGA